MRRAVGISIVMGGIELVGRVVGGVGLTSVNTVRGVAAQTGHRAMVTLLQLAEESPHGTGLAHVQGLGHFR